MDDTMIVRSVRDEGSVVVVDGTMKSSSTGDGDRKRN